MSRSLYQRPQHARWQESAELSGTIEVAEAVRTGWRWDHAAFVRQIEAIEERMALRFWHAAETEAERARIEQLYGPALARWRARCKASHGDAERFATKEGGGGHASRDRRA